MPVSFYISRLNLGSFCSAFAFDDRNGAEIASLFHDIKNDDNTQDVYYSSTDAYIANICF